MRPSGRSIRTRIGCVSLYQRGSQWNVYYREDGAQIRRQVGCSRAEAEYAASLINARIVANNAGLPPDRRMQIAAPLVPHLLPATPSANSPAKVVHIDQLRQAFLHHHEQVLRSALTTVHRYTTATLYLENFVNRQRIANALEIPVAAFIEHLRNVEVSPNGHPNTVRRRLRDKGVCFIAQTCRAMYHFGRRQGLLPRETPNPFTEAGLGKLPIRDAKPVFVFSAEQELTFFQASKPEEFALHFVLGKTGLRPAELRHLLIEDLDLQTGWLQVRSKPELGWLTKTNRERRVPLIAEVAELFRLVVGGRTVGPVFVKSTSPPVIADRANLAKHVLQRQLKSRSRLSRPLTRREEADVQESVWRDAGAMDADRIRISFLRVAKAANLPATCPKSWRHTFATLMQQANVDLLVRQETLGHKPALPEMSALGMTGVYTHTTPEFQRSEIERAVRLRPLSLEFMRSFTEVTRYA